jgi:hypothetical protein
MHVIKQTMKVIFEVLTAVDRNVAIFWDMAPCSFYVIRNFEGTYQLHLQGRKLVEQETCVLQMASHLGYIFLQNVDSSIDYTALYPTIWQHSKINYVGIMKNGVFWDITPCGSCKNRRFGGT